MAGSTDSGSATGRERAATLTIRRSRDGYDFELDVPAAGGGPRPTIWVGNQVVDADTRDLVQRARDGISKRLDRPVGIDAAAGATVLAPSAVGQLQHLG